MMSLKFLIEFVSVKGCELQLHCQPAIFHGPSDCAWTKQFKNCFPAGVALN